MTTSQRYSGATTPQEARTLQRWRISDVAMICVFWENSPCPGTPVPSSRSRDDKFGEFLIKVGGMELSVGHHDGRFSGWMWGNGRIETFNAPLTMLDVDNLIERLSR